MREIEKIPNNPQPQIKMKDWLRTVKQFHSFLELSFFMWRTLVRNCHSLCNHFTAFDQNIMNKDS